MMEDRKYRTSVQQSKGHRKEDKNVSAEENKDIVRRFWGVWEEGNIDLVDELLAPDYINHSPATPDQPTDPEGVKAVVGMFRSGMPDLRVVVEDMIAEGDKVVWRWTIRGTHTGPFQQLPATGKQVTITGINIVRIAGGQLVENWGEVDMLGLLQQLGAIPMPGQSG